jgi:ribosomal protein S27AE
MMNPLRWRKMTWALNVWNTLFLIWVVAAIAGGASDSVDCDTTVLTQADCDTAADVGTGIGVALIFFLWFLGFMVLGLIWLMTRPRHRQCPACGEDVKKGRTTCPKCGHDFLAAARTPVAPAPPA